MENNNELLLWPREAAKFISENSENVKICKENLKEVASMVLGGLESKEFEFGAWDTSTNDNFFNWMFLVDSLNFCFWSENDRQYTVSHKGEVCSGYLALCAAVNRALDEKGDSSFIDPHYYSNISRQELKHLLRSDDGLDIPLLDQRLDILHDNGKILIQKYGGSFENCYAEADGSARKLVELVVRNFPSFRDDALYKGRKVAFYKRAQILVADIWNYFGEKASFRDIDELSMFADYRVPQVLNYLKVLTYSKELEEKLKKCEELEFGGNLEVEIRGCSIWAVELLKAEMRECAGRETSSVPINSITIDYFLWQYRRKHKQVDEMVPYHRVKSIYY